MDLQLATNAKQIAEIRARDPKMADFLKQNQAELDPKQRARRAQLDAHSLQGSCGSGRDLAVDSLQSLLAGTPDTIAVHRYQAADLGFGAQHGFAVVVFPGSDGKPGMVFAVDPTIAQFMNPDLAGYSGAGLGQQDPKAQRAGLKVVRDILRDGFSPLTAETAQQYMLALGANQDQAATAAAMILSGQAAVNTDLVTSQGVARSTGASPDEIPNLDIDLVGTPPSGTEWTVVQEINVVLTSGDPAVGSPLWTELAALRDHLVQTGDRLARGASNRGPVTSKRK